MYPRVEYEMSEEDLKEILGACRPTPVIFGCGGIPLGGSQQKNANYAWAKLGEKMGFDHMTVRPIDGKSNRFFTAIPLETKEQKKEREDREAVAKKQARIKFLKEEIVQKEIELKELEKE